MSFTHIGFVDVFQLTMSEKDHGLVSFETKACDHFATCKLSLGRFLVQSHPDLEKSVEFFCFGKPKEHLKHSTAWPFLESDFLEVRSGFHGASH